MSVQIKRYIDEERMECTTYHFVNMVYDVSKNKINLIFLNGKIKSITLRENDQVCISYASDNI